MYTLKITTAQIKAIKIGDASTYPPCLDAWIAGGGVGQIPFYLTPEQLQQLKPILAKKLKVVFQWGEGTHAKIMGVPNIKEAMVTVNSVKPPTSPLRGEVILNPAHNKKLEVFRARAAQAQAQVQKA
jgi:hypothetical protein